MPRKAKLMHTILWRGTQISYGIYLRFNFRVSVKWHAKPPKTACLLVGNHANRNDPFIIGVRLRTPINYMANIEGVDSIRKLISSGIGCFNIKKGRADRQAFIEAMQLIKQGYSVGIFPEGDRSWLGETAKFSSAIPSLAKKLNVPVVMAKSTGHYLSRPRWSDIPRRGKIFIEFDVINQEQMNSLNKTEIYNRISDFIYSNDFTDERIKKVQFTGKNLAVGIENILWKCPICRTEDSIAGNKDTIKCSNCQETFKIDGNQNIKSNNTELAKLSVNNVMDWFNWQIKEFKAHIAENFDTEILNDNNVELLTEPIENEWQSAGKGSLSLSKTSLIWEGNNKKMEFKLDEIMNIVDNFNEYAILNLKQERFQLVFSKTCSYKWTNALQILQSQE